MATPFFQNFRRAALAPAYFTSPPTVFGEPAQPNAPLSQTVFNAMFRHFLYALGDDLKLPEGAFYAGSSCVAALRLPAWANQLSLHSLERRARTKIAEPLVEQTLRKGLFRTEWPVVSRIMSFLRDDFSLGDFNEAVGKALYRPVRSLATYSFDSSSDEEVEEAVHVHFDGDGRGPYGRADIDIIIVADSVEEARPIVEATIAKVAKRYKNHRIYETPCSVQIIGDFPQRHVQIVTVLNKSLDEYLLFVDLDCTALAFDGETLWGCPRSYLAMNTGFNIVPQQMLENRSDTPRRLFKYSQRGYASLIPEPLGARAEQLLVQARAIGLNRGGRGGLRFLDIDWFDDEEEAINVICGREGRIYTETNLPRGFGITAEMTGEILKRLQAQAILAGRTTCVRPYEGHPALVFKAEKRPENWVLWGFSS